MTYNLNYEKIILFSPPRSGSTLVYNLLKNTFTDIEVVKTHKYNYDIKNLYIITIRHPYNSIISIGVCNNVNIGDKLKLLYKNYMDCGGNDLINNNFDNDNIIILNYELFFNNYDIIYESISNKLNISIPYEVRKNVNNQIDIENVKEIIKKFKNFSEYDIDNQYHGNHISIYNGKTNYIDILTMDDVNYLISLNDLNKILIKFSY